MGLPVHSLGVQDRKLTVLRIKASFRVEGCVDSLERSDLKSLFFIFLFLFFLLINCLSFYNNFTLGDTLLH